MQCNWSVLKNQKRFEVHIHGFSYDKFVRETTERINHKKNIQMPRIFNLKDPNVTIIYIIPFKFNDEL